MLDYYTTSWLRTATFIYPLPTVGVLLLPQTLVSQRAFPHIMVATLVTTLYHFVVIVFGSCLDCYTAYPRLRIPKCQCDPMPRFRVPGFFGTHGYPTRLPTRVTLTQLDGLGCGLRISRSPGVSVVNRCQTCPTAPPYWLP